MAPGRRYSRVLAIILVLLSSSFASHAAGNSQKSGSWFSRWWNTQSASEFESVIDGLKKTYKKNLRPLEEMYAFRTFHGNSMNLEDSYFDAKPMVLLLGQYSTGKTTFVQHLLQSDFPGSQVGPEPTTDVFMAVMYSERKQVFPGSLAALNKSNNFQGLQRFGSVFMHEHFKASTLPNAVLRSITLVDTPGILPGQKREYDFNGVCNWFAEEAGMIILFFDVSKIVISDEFRRVIELIQKHHKKLFVVINKADSITTPELIRVHGGVMWGLGKIINTHEFLRLYMGSFRNEPLQHDENQKLFEKHSEELVAAIQEVSRTEILQKVDRMIKRAHMVKVHAYILGHLKNEMPLVYGHQQRQHDLINNLETEFMKLQTKYELLRTDFPDVGMMQRMLRTYDFTMFAPPSKAKEQISAVERMVSEDLAEITRMMTERNANEGNTIRGGVFDEECSDHCHELHE